LKTFSVFVTLQKQRLATPTSTQRSLELYTGFYTACNPKPNFLSPHHPGISCSAALGPSQICAFSNAAFSAASHR
jgi:hypothetical protein